MSDSKNYDILPPSAPDPRQRRNEGQAGAQIKLGLPARLLKKPSWIRVKASSGEAVGRIKRLLRERKLNSVCEAATCPNLGECFSHGTATFMIMGDICTRHCPFCDVAHGRPSPLDEDEPLRLADAVRAMGLRYVVITSVNRDDLRDGGAGHFAACIRALRQFNAGIQIEVLVPDFRNRLERALGPLGQEPPDVFNHNLETVPRLYDRVRPGADYGSSLELLRRYREIQPGTPTKSGLMLGLGETLDEVLEVMRDLRGEGCDMLTLGQYLQPSLAHLPVKRFVTPEEFETLRQQGEAMGFSNVASGPLVRSSYHADRQADSVLGHP